MNLYKRVITIQLNKNVKQNKTTESVNNKTGIKINNSRKQVVEAFVSAPPLLSEAKQLIDVEISMS